MFSTGYVQYEEHSFRESRKIDKLESEIRNLERRLSREISATKTSAAPSSKEHLEGIRDEILSMIDADSIIESRLDSVNDMLALNNIRSEFDRLRENLLDYRSANRAQYVLNLFMGLFLGLGAIIIAGYLVFEGRNIDLIGNDGAPNYGKIVSFYVPWITIIIVIEFLALFFLKLYRENIHTERYLRDELTSIGLKISGVEASIRLNDNTLNKKVTEALLQSERHQMLSKGQTTVEVEKARLDKESFKESLDFLSAMTPWDTAKKALFRRQSPSGGSNKRSPRK